MVQVSLAVRTLISALGKYGRVDSDIGKGIVDALRTLSKVVPEVSEQLNQSEVASMMGGAQQATPQGGPQQQRPQGQPPTMLGTGRPMPIPMR